MRVRIPLALYFICGVVAQVGLSAGRYVRPERCQGQNAEVQILPTPFLLVGCPSLVGSRTANPVWLNTHGFKSHTDRFRHIFLGSLPEWPKGAGLGPVEERLYASSNPLNSIFYFLLFFSYIIFI